MDHDEFGVLKPEADILEINEDEAFRHSTLRDKNALLADIRYQKRMFTAQAEHEHTRPAAFYITLQNLIDRFIDRLEKTILFEELEMYWSYEYEITCTGIILRLMHHTGCSYDAEGDLIGSIIDEEFDLFTIDARLLTVDEYSKRYGVEPVTVRQWIRRAKLRSAVKLGKEWRIPELAIPGQRGYSSVTYKWKYELQDVPEELAFLRAPAILNIYKSTKEKNSYTIAYSYLGEPQEATRHHIVVGEKERIQIEMQLIGNPLVKCDADSYGIFG